MVLQLQEAGAHLGLLVAGVGDVDVHNVLDAAGAGAHDHHTLGQDDGLLHVVGDEEAGLLLLLPGVEQLLLQLGAGLGVQGAEGLIHQQHLGVDGIGPGDGHALLHAAGELLGIGLGEALQIHHLQILVGDLLGLLVALALELEAELHVLLHGEPGEQGVLLEHDAAVGAGALHGLAVHQHLALGGALQAADDVEQGGLAAAGGAHHAHKFVLMDVQIHAVQGHHLAVAAVELLDHVVNMYLYRGIYA